MVEPAAVTATDPTGEEGESGEGLKEELKGAGSS